MDARSDPRMDCLARYLFQNRSITSLTAGLGAGQAHAIIDGDAPRSLSDGLVLVARRRDTAVRRDLIEPRPLDQLHEQGGQRAA